MLATQSVNEHCLVLRLLSTKSAPNAYSKEDYRMLQKKNYSFDFQPKDDNCNTIRKTSCSLVNLETSCNQIEYGGYGDEDKS